MRQSIGGMTNHGTSTNETALSLLSVGTAVLFSSTTISMRRSRGRLEGDLALSFSVNYRCAPPTRRSRDVPCGRPYALDLDETSKRDESRPVEGSAFRDRGARYAGACRFRRVDKNADGACPKRA